MSREELKEPFSPPLPWGEGPPMCVFPKDPISSSMYRTLHNSGFKSC